MSEENTQRGQDSRSTGSRDGPPRRDSRPSGSRYSDRDRDRDDDRGSGSRPRRSRSRRPNRRRGAATACTTRCVGKQAPQLNYKQVDVLRRFVTERGKIRPRRQTGNCAKHQRTLARAIKRARFIALLPYTAEHGFGSESRRPDRS